RLSLHGSQIRELNLGQRSLPPALEHLDLVGQVLPSDLVERICAEPSRFRGIGLAASDEATQVLTTIIGSGNANLAELELGPGPGAGHWLRPTAQPIAGLLPHLRRLAISNPWTIDWPVMEGLLTGEVTPALQSLTLRHLGLGNPDLGGGFTPTLRELELEYCIGFLEGLATSDAPLPLERLSLDGIKVYEDQLSAWLTSCPNLVSLRLSRVATFGTEGLAAVLDAVGDQLLQLVVIGLHAHGDADYAREIGQALTASSMPQLRELELDTSIDIDSFIRLLGDDLAPQLERLALIDDGLGENAWLALAEHAQPRLHWITSAYEGTEGDLQWLLDAPDSQLAAALISTV
ncbi:MAG: hypothetical protein AAGC55_12280, partial [Myxococcota bacterium]